MKKIITLLITLSFVSPVLYAEQAINHATKEKHHVRISVKKHHINKHEIAQNKVKHTKIAVHHKDKANAKNLVNAELKKDNQSPKLNPANQSSELAKKEIPAKEENPNANVQANDAQVAQLNDEKNNINADQIAQSAKGFFQNVWDQVTKFFR